MKINNEMFRIKYKMKIRLDIATSLKVKKNENRKKIN